MMKRITIVVLLFVQTQFVNSQVDSSGMTIEKVIMEFYKNYSFNYFDKFVTFEKRKNNWFVVYNGIQDGELAPEEKKLFYDGKAGKFQALQLEENREYKEINIYEYLSPYDVRNFNLQPYYGYKGWYKDVIKEYENKNGLSDDELYCLGRAYSSNYMNLVSDHDGFALKKEIWKLPFSMNCLTSEQIDQFEKGYNNAINCFKKLADRNPSYETIVGKIGMKYANEVMVKYNIFLAYAAKYAEKMVLPADLYTEEQLAKARKVLETCPTNAILCSYGDNDHYPVQYLQKTKGLRKDVCFINITLLGIDRYVYRYTFPQFDALPITISVDPSFYLGRKNEMIYLLDSSNIFEMSNLKSFLQNFKPNDIPVLYTNSISLTLSNELSKNKKKLTIPLLNVKHFFKNEWILLEILENLNGRKICFPGLFYEEAFKGLNAHLEQQGDLWIFKN